MNELAERLQKRLGDKSFEDAEQELLEMESRLNFSARLVSLATIQAEMVNASEVEALASR